jgi:hypothetical protein
MALHQLPLVLSMRERVAILAKHLQRSRLYSTMNIMKWLLCSPRHSPRDEQLAMLGIEMFHTGLLLWHQCFLLSWCLSVKTISPFHQSVQFSHAQECIDLAHSIFCWNWTKPKGGETSIEPCGRRGVVLPQLIRYSECMHQSGWQNPVAQARTDNYYTSYLHTCTCIGISSAGYKPSTLWYTALCCLQFGRIMYKC